MHAIWEKECWKKPKTNKNQQSKMLVDPVRNSGTPNEQGKDNISNGVDVSTNIYTKCEFVSIVQIDNPTKASDFIMLPNSSQTFN
jgi:hypothetical protein